MSSPFDALTLDQLRSRRSAKWTAYPSDVVPAWIAEMDVPLAPTIRATLLDAVENDDTGYATRPLLTPAFSQYVRTAFDWEIDAARVTLAADVLAALAGVLRAVTAPRARIVINSPVYPPFFRTIAAIGRTVENVPLRHDGTAWSIDFTGLERAFAAGAQAYILCTPHNPLGRIFDEGDLVRVVELAQRYGVVVIADEIHAPLTYPGETFTPFVRVAERLGFDGAVALWSASKAWNLAGLKCATIVAGSAALHQKFAGIHSDPGQFGVLASVAAYESGGAWLHDVVAHLDRNRWLLRDLLADALPGVRYEPPQAGYLAWLDCRALGLDGQPVDVFLARGRVALSRGLDFGTEGAACVRLNFGTTAALLTEIVSRMAQAVSPA
jgi:cystathionine beta-lyase